MSDRYILDDSKTPVPCPNLEEWAKWFEGADRHVAQDVVGDVRVSTVFLGVNHRFGPGSPLLFETMIFGGPNDQYQTRCTFWDDAVKQHAEAVALARGGLH